MARIITKELALKIVDKLKATKLATRNKAHDEYLVQEDGIRIAIIRIRRSQRRTKATITSPKTFRLARTPPRNLANVR